MKRASSSPRSGKRWGSSCPSPDGRRWREAPDEGHGKHAACERRPPHPAPSTSSGATLSRGRGTVVAALILLFLAAPLHAEKSLRWSRLAVTANLDADGRLHVAERHTIVFNGDWNGGERIFRRTLEENFRLTSVGRIDDAGNAIPLREAKSLAHVDDYAWTDSKTLRWRGRLPSDPPFQNRAITYLIEYTDGNILVQHDRDEYVLDHNFGLPDLQWPIDAYSLDLTLDPAWQPIDNVPAHITRANQPRGENVTITARLRHVGAAAPAAVSREAPAAVRYGLAAILLIGALLSLMQFYRRERSVGRFAPLPDPSSIDRKWLDANVFKYLPEVVGAAWDDRTGAAEVSAVLARMVQEGKMTSRIEKHGFLKNDDLVLTLQRSIDSFDGYEAALVKSLFIDGDTTSTEKIKKFYKKKGFDPASKIREPLARKSGEVGKQGGAPKVAWRLEIILAIAGIALIVVGAFSGPLSIVGGIAAASVVLVLWVAGFVPALDYRRRIVDLRRFSLEFVPQILLILAVPLIASQLRLSLFTQVGLVLLALGATRAILHAAMTRDGGERLENRRRLAAARAYFARELQRPKPALEDAWFPYLLAFGLGPHVDRWFHSFGSPSQTSSSSTSSSTSTSSSSGWTGGGGAFGGAGASGAWGVAAAGMASGVAAPGSGGGGGGGGGGSSGGGGGGGW
jgi:uncharacterized membrane protein YgcG